MKIYFNQKGTRSLCITQWQKIFLARRVV